MPSPPQPDGSGFTLLAADRYHWRTFQRSMHVSAQDNSTTGSLSYKDSGVDIDAGNALVERIKPAVARTRRPEVLAGIGGFGGLFALRPDLKAPVLVSGTDGGMIKRWSITQLDTTSPEVSFTAIDTGAVYSLQTRVRLGAAL